MGSTLDKIYEYQAFIVYLGLPAFAFSSFLLFIDKDKYNFTEHLAINSYWIAQFSVVPFVIYVSVFGFFDVSFTSLENYAVRVVMF